MTEDHPNAELLKRLDLRNLAASKGLIAEDVVWRIVDGRIVEVWDIVPGDAGPVNRGSHRGRQSSGT